MTAHLTLKQKLKLAAVKIDPVEPLFGSAQYAVREKVSFDRSSQTVLND